MDAAADVSVGSCCSISLAAGVLDVEAAALALGGSSGAASATAAGVSVLGFLNGPMPGRRLRESRRRNCRCKGLLACARHVNRVAHLHPEEDA